MTTRRSRERIGKMWLEVKSRLDTAEIEQLIEQLQALVIRQKEEAARPVNDPNFPPHDGPKQWLETKWIGKHGPYLYLRYELNGKRKSRYLKGIKRGDPIPWITSTEAREMRYEAEREARQQWQQEHAAASDAP